MPQCAVDQIRPIIEHKHEGVEGYTPPFLTIIRSMSVSYKHPNLLLTPLEKCFHRGLYVSCLFVLAVGWLKKKSPYEFKISNLWFLFCFSNFHFRFVSNIGKKRNIYTKKSWNKKRFYLNTNYTNHLNFKGNLVYVIM